MVISCDLTPNHAVPSLGSLFFYVRLLFFLSEMIHYLKENYAVDCFAVLIPLIPQFQWDTLPYKFMYSAKKCDISLKNDSSKIFVVSCFDL